jgi:hypothetical protein
MKELLHTFHPSSPVVNIVTFCHIAFIIYRYAPFLNMSVCFLRMKILPYIIEVWSKSRNVTVILINRHYSDFTSYLNNGFYGTALSHIHDPIHDPV